MREIDQIVGLRSKLGFPLLGNPHRPIPHPMDLGLAARSRLQGADRQSLSRFLRASQCGAKNGSHRTRLMRQSQTGFLPAHLASLSTILRGFSGSRLPFLPPAACCRRFPQSAPARPPHPHSRANRFSAFLAPASPPRVPLSPRARRSPELQFRNALSASPPPRQRHSRHQNRSWLAVGLPNSPGTALPPMRKRVV